MSVLDKFLDLMNESKSTEENAVEPKVNEGSDSEDKEKSLLDKFLEYMETEGGE